MAEAIRLYANMVVQVRRWLTNYDSESERPEGKHKKNKPPTQRVAPSITRSRRCVAPLHAPGPPCRRRGCYAKGHAGGGGDSPVCPAPGLKKVPSPPVITYSFTEGDSTLNSIPSITDNIATGAAPTPNVVISTPSFVTGQATTSKNQETTFGHKRDGTTTSTSAISAKKYTYQSNCSHDHSGKTKSSRNVAKKNARLKKELAETTKTNTVGQPSMFETDGKIKTGRGMNSSNTDTVTHASQVMFGPTSQLVTRIEDIAYKTLFEKTIRSVESSAGTLTAVQKRKSKRPTSLCSDGSCNEIDTSDFSSDDDCKDNRKNSTLEGDTVKFDRSLLDETKGINLWAEASRNWSKKLSRVLELEETGLRLDMNVPTERDITKYTDTREDDVHPLKRVETSTNIISILRSDEPSEIDDRKVIFKHLKTKRTEPSEAVITSIRIPSDGDCESIKEDFSLSPKAERFSLRMSQTEQVSNAKTTSSKSVYLSSVASQIELNELHNTPKMVHNECMLSEKLLPPPDVCQEHKYNSKKFQRLLAKNELSHYDQSESVCLQNDVHEQVKDLLKRVQDDIASQSLQILNCSPNISFKQEMTSHHVQKIEKYIQQKTMSPGNSNVKIEVSTPMVTAKNSPTIIENSGRSTCNSISMEQNISSTELGQEEINISSSVKNSSPMITAKKSITTGNCISYSDCSYVSTSSFAMEVNVKSTSSQTQKESQSSEDSQPTGITVMHSKSQSSNEKELLEDDIRTEDENIIQRCIVINIKKPASAEQTSETSHSDFSSTPDTSYDNVEAEIQDASSSNAFGYQVLDDASSEEGRSAECEFLPVHPRVGLLVARRRAHFVPLMADGSLGVAKTRRSTLRRRCSTKAVARARGRQGRARGRSLAATVAAVAAMEAEAAAESEEAASAAASAMEASAKHMLAAALEAARAAEASRRRRLKTRAPAPSPSHAPGHARGHGPGPANSTSCDRRSSAPGGWAATLKWLCGGGACGEAGPAETPAGAAAGAGAGPGVLAGAFCVPCAACGACARCGACMACGALRRPSQ